MVNVKEMPYSEKYALVQKNIKFGEVYGLPFIQKHLGDQALEELRSIWQEGIKPIPENASDEEKYEAAYSNWILMEKSMYSFIRERLGDDGIEKFKRAQVEALKKENAGPALILLKLIRAFSPGSAFTMMTKQMSYQLQWLTPFSLSELTRNKAVLNIPSCKILDYPGTDDLCYISCQIAYPMWVAEQFKTQMKFERQGNSCTCTLTPLK